MLQENLKNVQAKIDAALARRSEEKITGSAVTLVAVTKNHPADVITEALSLGVTTIGENRVQEARAKREMLGAVGRWHLIGHLQTNKAKQAVAIFDMIGQYRPRGTENRLQPRRLCSNRAAAGQL